MPQVTIETLKCGDVLRGKHRDHTVVSVESGRHLVYLCTRVGGNTTVLSKVRKGTHVVVIKTKIECK